MKFNEQDLLINLTKLNAPFIVVFGIYVIMHGEIGPGGGFQGGVIVASAYILYALVFGLDEARRFISRRLSDTLGALGVLFYAGVGVVTMLRGGSFLDYNLLSFKAQPSPLDLAHAQALGMTLVEIGVGLTVAAVMVTIFSEMVEE